MRLALFLLVVTVSLFIAGRLLARRVGGEVSRRFLETKTDYTNDSLRTWISKHEREAKWYAFPILVPVDLLFMVFLAALLALASVALAGQIGALREHAWLFTALPALYLAADLAEDALLVRFLFAPEAIGPAMVRCTQVLTKVKIWSVKSAALQTAALLVAVFIIDRCGRRG